MAEISMEILQTMVRKAFDPETISVTIGKVEDALHSYSVTVRDEVKQAYHSVVFTGEHTIKDIEDFIQETAVKLDLVAGPSIEEQNQKAAASTIGDGHASDCALHNGPYMPPAACDCGANVANAALGQNDGSNHD